MAIELKIPSAGESITEVVVSEWLKKEGAWVDADEIVAMIETDKANIEVVSPASGKLSKVLKGAGDTATVGDVIGLIDEAAERPKTAAVAAQTPAAAPSSREEKRAPAATSAQKAATAAPSSVPQPAAPSPTTALPPAIRATPAARRALRESGLDVAALDLGEDSLLTVSDVKRLAGGVTARAPATGVSAREEEVVPMTPLRKRIAERLVQAQSTAAILTTFNEVDLGAVMELRKAHQEAFTKRYGVKLGFMSFFIKAAIEALKEFPAVNAEIRGEHIVYKNFYDIGVAVGGGRGLVVPVLRSAERMSFAEIEKTIADFGERARSNRLKPEELQGGTFTISNGGVYGSMLSTPILNPPQSGILGMHAIQERPVARNGQVVVRPMMYLALSYDHRIIDGREAVSFLVRIKQALEEPTRILLEV